ncbi:unnamed protein product [Chilo suppressalis]|uniref:BTB domain-containing protein n=1 Tax=Chilo suppressalis TaxID=168631 RepID=A0ABN8B9P5_CHISP|nr:unnamed protein product [Chilo suppressalis]
MKKSASLEKINGFELVSNARYAGQNLPENCSLPKKRHKRVADIFEHYCITIKPKIHKSSSLTDLTAQTNNFTLDLYKQTTRVWPRCIDKHAVYGSSGDSSVKVHTNNNTEIDQYMSWNLKGKKIKRKPEMSPDTTYSKKYTENCPCNRNGQELNQSSGIEDSSECSIDPNNTQKGAAFPFKPTPSGNLKVQSNQVVFQSSTVGVLLADPTQAKLKVKFIGKAAGEPEDPVTSYDVGSESEPQLQFNHREHSNNNQVENNNDRNIKEKHRSVREDKGKELGSLGYALAEAVDWMHVQLPKKQDLFQEFYRRIHNHINTDTVIHIGNEEFHCHSIVLQVYSNFFDMNPHREIELSISDVSCEVFQSIYEWMIFSGQESSKILRKDNILDLFCAAQFLSIKDLENQCWSFIVNENLFNEDTAFALYREARLRRMSPVVDLMVPRIMRFFLPLVASKDFLELEPEEILTILKSNYICVTSEIEVLMAGVRWLYADWSNRQQLAVEVMRCVRFGLISPWQLVDIKRNPDNGEILEIVNESEVQQMVDDGLAYVIIKYWYGNNSKNYYHWIDVLGLTEPAERNWIGEEKNHVTYKDFLKYLEQFMVPKEQMYQQMSMMQPPRRNDDIPAGLRGADNDMMEMRRPKMDFPLPFTLKGLTGDKEKFPTMSEFIDSRKKAQDGLLSPSSLRSPPVDGDPQQPMSSRSPTFKKPQSILEEQRKFRVNQQKEQSHPINRINRIQEVHMCTVHHDHRQIFDPPEKDSGDDLMTTNSECSTVTTESNVERNTSLDQYCMTKKNEKRHSVAASYLAAATAVLAGNRRTSHNSPTTAGDARRASEPASRPEGAPRASVSPPQPQLTSPNNCASPQFSLFNHSKESLAKINMNKLSTSILGPSNKNYIADGSLFNWDKETVLVFGGIDPHTNYGLGRNTGKDIYRYDPVTNVWENVGDLPEPRHHHSVAFLRGRVYLVGGADPRDDDIRGKSVVVSTVWSYEPVTRSWYSENGLTVPRKNFGLVVHRMALYAIGGQDKKGRVLRSVERFDPKTGSWNEVRSMSVARMAVATVKYRDYIWVAGGMTGEKKRPVCKIVECYNSKTNEWTEIHSLRFPRCFATLFAMNDRLYIIGGAGKISDKEKTASSVGSIDVWDWKDREWKPQTDMSIPRHGHALAYLGTQLIIIGGVTTIYMRALNNVESYCCERSAWIRGVATLPSPLSGHDAVTLPPACLM